MSSEVKNINTEELKMERKWAVFCLPGAHCNVWCISSIVSLSANSAGFAYPIEQECGSNYS